MALASTDPKVLMGQAKCFSCLTPKLQFNLQTYLLAVIGMGDTSAAGVQALSVASTCFSCFTFGELIAARGYLFAVWLGLDTSLAGVAAIAKTAACDYACLTPKQQEQVRTYLLAVTAGVGTDVSGVRASELAAKCFECPTTKRQLEMQVYLLSTIAPGAPTTVSAIMAAAKCFMSCVPPELHEAFQTALAAQAAGRSTPPCVTPTAPSAPTVFQALNNILKISWTQPANPGSLIMSYTVSYGTTQGGPYANTVVSHSKSASLTGLTSGTQYFFVVTANSFSGCSSAASTEGNGTTTGTPAVCNAGLTFANAWATRVVANGGAAPSQATINAIANFQCGLITDGLDVLMKSWNAFVPDNLTAAITPQLLGIGLDPWTNHNFVNGDLTVNGLVGDGATKFLQTGQVGTNLFPGTPVTNSGITAYAFTNPSVAQAAITGCSDGSSSLCALEMYNGITSLLMFDVASDLLNVPNVGFTGYVSANRTAVNALAIYEASSVVPHHTLASNVVNNTGNGAANPFAFTVFCYNDNTGTLLFTNQRVSFIAYHQGLTSAQSALLFARIQTLRTALGGGVV